MRDFVPLEAGKVGICLCGLAVQSEPHVGHVRSGVNFDVLRRWLTARGYDAHFIRNIIDIEDKVLAKPAEQGRPWYNLAYTMWIDLDKAYNALNVAPPTHGPAASGHVPEVIEIIVTLIGRGTHTQPRTAPRTSTSTCGHGRVAASVGVYLAGRLTGVALGHEPAAVPRSSILTVCRAFSVSCAGVLSRQAGPRVVSGLLVRTMLGWR